MKIRSIDSIPQSANLTPLRAPKPAISHLLLFGLSPENVEKILKVLNYQITDYSSLRKNVVSSAYAVYRNVFLKLLRPSIFSFCMINQNTISKTSINEYTQNGSHYLLPLPSLK